MQCPECLLDDVTIDEYANTCYCPNCHKLWTMKIEVKKDVVFPIGILLGILTLIPIVNIPIILVVQRLNIKEEYIKCYVMNVLITIITIFVCGSWILSKGFELRDLADLKAEERIDNIILSIMTQERVNQNKEQEIKRQQELIELMKQDDLYQQQLNNLTKRMNQDSDSLTNMDKVFLYLDGTKMSGDKVLSLLDDFNDSEQVTILLQTKAMKEKYGDYYKAYCILPECCKVIQDNALWYLDVTKKTSFYNFDTSPLLDDEGNPVVISYDDFTKKNLIWKINASAEFLCMVRISDGRKIFGFREVNEE